MLDNTLPEKGYAMYGSEYCGACQYQKELFGKSFQYVDYVDCAYNENKCKQAQVEYYPTWVVDGNLIVGVQTLDKLSKISDCPS
jgi:protein-disulfide isomerase